MAEPALSVVIDDDTDDVRVDEATGTIEVLQEDGSVVVHLDAGKPKQDESDEDPFYANLAKKLPPQRLALLANDLYEAISADDHSRQGSLSIYTRQLELLGLELKEPRASVSDSSSSGIDGLSTVTNPLMLEACLKGWANAQAELLPATGPVKIKDEGPGDNAVDELSERFESDMNYFFTKIASEYYPDTSSMLLWGTHLRGSGFKKIYRCPLKRRPISESVDGKDLIVSDTKKDLRSSTRITHEISMAPSLMKRMVFAEAYRDVPLVQPSAESGEVDEAVAAIQGTSATSSRPEDQPYKVWECQCELDLKEFAPTKFKDEGIPLPYIFTMEKESRAVLAIRRDWDEDDEECTRKRLYVRYPYVPGPGFYGTGLGSILGNPSAAMTAIWRIALDGGMFANFPGGVIAKDAVRQNTAQIKVGPTEFYPVDVPSGKDIRTMMMPLPYKDVTPGLLSLMDKIQAQASAAGSAAEIPTGEGLQNVPVGTMLAQIEQATKIMAAAFKGMHNAQAEEIEMIIDLFREHPEDFWRNNHDCPPDYWDVEKFNLALKTCKLIPVSDPNVPSHIHRIAKAVGLVQLYQVPAFASQMDPKEGLRRVLRAMREDPVGLLLPPPSPDAPPAPPDPTLLESSAKVIKAQSDAALAQGKLQQLPQETKIKADEIAAEQDIADKNLERERIIHATDTVKSAIDLGAQQRQQAHQAEVDRRDQTREDLRTAHDIGQDHHQRRMDVSQHALDVHEALNPPPKPPKEGT